MIDDELMSGAVAMARGYFERHPSNKSLRSRVSDACFYTVASDAEDSYRYSSFGVGDGWYAFVTRCLAELA